jgi:hypothetical protein
MNWRRCEARYSRSKKRDRGVARGRGRPPHLGLLRVVGQFACGAANLGRSRLFRRPEPAESRLRAELPAPQNPKLTHCPLALSIISQDRSLLGRRELEDQPVGTFPAITGGPVEVAG